MKFFQNILIIVVVVTIIFLIKKLMITKKLEKKENKKLENKNLSIYELIKSSIQSDGSLPENFSLPQEETDEISWADGAMDGVFLYHTARNEDSIEPLKNILFQISEGKFEEAHNNLNNSDFSIVSVRMPLLDWIIQEKKQINANNLYEFTISQLKSSKNKESIKFSLVVLLLMGVEKDVKAMEIIKTLALSDEFTLFCLDIITRLENSNEEIFEIVKKVKGWGRVHSISYLEATNDEIKDWLLEEGCHNEIDSAYTALTCAKKINLLELLEKENISNKKFNDISYLITALLDEGPASGISSLEHRKILIERYLKKAKYLSSTENDYRAVMMIKEYIKDGKKINNNFIKICNEILNSEKTVNNIKELMKKGYSYDIAKYIKIDIEPYALEYLQSNLLKNPYIIYDISKKENIEKLVLLVERRLPLEKMKGFPTDKINFINEEFTVLDVAVRTLENFEGIGKSLIIYALNSPYVNVRYGAANTLGKWKDMGYIFPDEIIENIENLEKIEVDDELKEKLNKLVK